MTLKLIASVVFLFAIGNVNSIAPAAAWAIGYAVGVVAEVVVAVIGNLVDGDEELREKYTSTMVKNLYADDNRFLYLVVRDYIWDDSSAAGYIDTETYQLDGAWQDYGYVIVVFDKRQECKFIRDGDGGYRNWAYSAGGWTRSSDNTITYSPPKSPQLSSLIGDCVNVFNPYYYKYLRAYRDGDDSGGQDVTAETSDAGYTSFILSKSGDKYRFYGDLAMTYLDCKEWTNYWMEIREENKSMSPQCEASDNCYSIISSYGYFDVDDNGAKLNCDHSLTRRSFGEDNIFIIEPCGLF